MIQLLPQKEILTPNTFDAESAVEYINSYINNTRCENLSVDISFMNVFDASYVSTLCSAHHYIKYPEGKIDWIISSNLAEYLSSYLNLGNAEYSLS